MELTRILNIDSDGAADCALAPDTVLGRGGYVVNELLGQGGFGITYLAHDLSLDREVVIKECFPESLCHRDGQNVVVRSAAQRIHFEKCVEMFMREARSIAKLAHPNIVHVHSIFEDNSTAYMVLDLIEGSDLFDYLDDPAKQLSPQEIHDLTSQVLNALKVVHGQNLLHRDISPDNILYSRRTGPTLIDFGSAREFAAAREKVKTTLLAVKDGYSPFEFYVAGAAHSPASDFYALGGTIYHLVAGDAPPSSQIRHAAVHNGEPDPYAPLAGRFPDYDPQFLAAIDTALALPVAQRIQSVDDWLGRIAQAKKPSEATKALPSKPQPKSLGDLVNETNQQLEQGGMAEEAAPFLLTDEVAPRDAAPDWRDEFNLETQVISQEFAAEQEARDATPAVEEPAEAEVVQKQDGLLSRLSARRNPAIEELEEVDDVDLEKAALDLYFEKQRARKAKGRGIGFAGFAYLSSSLVLVVLAVLLAINHERMQEDGSWTVMFSLQGLCRSGELRVFMPVPIDCSERGEARLLDLDDRDRILRFNTSDRIN